MAELGVMSFQAHSPVVTLRTENGEAFQIEPSAELDALVTGSSADFEWIPDQGPVHYVFGEEYAASAWLERPWFAGAIADGGSE